MRQETIEIKALENGFLIEYNWYPLGEDGMTLYKTKKYTFKTWQEVSDWVVSNPLTQPPIS